MAEDPANGTGGGREDGAADAARRLFQAHSALIYGYCLRQLGSIEEAEDAVQETFLNASRSLKRGFEPDSPVAWLRKIAENVCLGRHRIRLAKPVERLAGMQDAVAAPGRETDELFWLDDALRSLPEAQRRAFLLREWQGLTYDEIAAKLDRSHLAVASLIFRARQALAEWLTTPKPRGRGRRNHGLDLGSPLAALKSALAGGTASNMAATVVAATALVAIPPIGYRLNEVTTPPATASSAAPSRAYATEPSPVASAAERADRGRPVPEPVRKPPPPKPDPPPRGAGGHDRADAQRDGGQGDAAPLPGEQAADPASEGSSAGETGPDPPPEAESQGGGAQGPLAEEGESQSAHPDDSPAGDTLPSGDQGGQAESGEAPRDITSNSSPKNGVGNGPPENLRNGSPENPGNGPQGNGPPENPGKGPPADAGVGPQGTGPPESPGNGPQGNGSPPESRGNGPPENLGNGPPDDPGNSAPGNPGNGPPNDPGNEPQGNGPPENPGDGAPDDPGNRAPENPGHGPSEDAGNGPEENPDNGSQGNGSQIELDAAVAQRDDVEDLALERLAGRLGNARAARAARADHNLITAAGELATPEGK